MNGSMAVCHCDADDPQVDIIKEEISPGLRNSCYGLFDDDNRFFVVRLAEEKRLAKVDAGEDGLCLEPLAKVDDQLKEVENFFDKFIMVDENEQFELSDSFTVGFLIYKMNWDSLCWEEIHTLGEYSMFLGKNHSLYVSAADFVGCRPNCVYYSNDGGGKHDVGIYSLSNKSIDPLPCDLDESKCCFGYPVWVTPNPC
jgi:hypothetical protein